MVRVPTCLTTLVAAAVVSVAVGTEVDLAVDCPQQFVSGFEASCGQLLVATDLLALTTATATADADCGRVVRAAEDCTAFIVEMWETLSEKEQESCDPVTEAYLSALDEASAACYHKEAPYGADGGDSGDAIAIAERNRRTGSSGSSGSGSGSSRRDGWQVVGSGSGRNAAITIASTTPAPSRTPTATPTTSTPTSTPTTSAPTTSPTRTPRPGPGKGKGARKQCGVGFMRSDKRPAAGMKIMYRVPVPHKPACADRCDHNELAGCTGFKTSRNKTDKTLICQLFTGAVETKCRRGKKKHQVCCIRDPSWVTKAPLTKDGAEPAWKSAVEFEAKGNPESGVGGKRGKSAGPGNLALKLQSGAQSAMGKKGDAALRETGGPGPKTSKMTVGDLDLPRASTSAVAKTSSHAFVALGLVFGMAAFGLGARRYKSKNRTPYTMVPSYNGRPTNADQLDGVIDGSVLQCLMSDDQTDRKYLSFI